MAKRTAIIDIGSNSARLVIFQKTSKYGFHLICEQKSRVRIGEGAYENAGNLQKIGTDRAYLALESFSTTVKEFAIDKIVCVATSALRDAPNKYDFINKIKKDFDMVISVIPGTDEARYGAVAASNLLPIDDAISIDIGGGSTDMALIRDNKIIDTCSLNIGTVRLKELFFDKNSPLKDAKAYIKNELSKLPKSFQSDIAIGIGGSARALSKAIMTRNNYPLDKLHAFRYKLDDEIDYLRHIPYTRMDNLSALSIKDNRHDTIREGALILIEVLDCIDAREMITSGVGVREGIYLDKVLNITQETFPKNINLSIQSIRDRFDTLGLIHGNKRDLANKLFKLFINKIDRERDYISIIEKALSLSNIGKMLTIYHQNNHAQYISMQELNYDFSHEDMMLISLLLGSKETKGYSRELYEQYRLLLPSKKSMKWISFIYVMTLILHRGTASSSIDFEYEDGILHIISQKSLYLAIESVSKMKKPKKLKVVFD